MDTDDLLATLAWRAIRDWRRRREVDPAIRREWVRLYVGVIRWRDEAGRTGEVGLARADEFRALGRRAPDLSG